MVQNFVELRRKNNLDLSTKRLRLNEYIASMLSIRIGESVSRVLTYGNKINLKQVLTNIFKFSGSIVIQSLQNSQLLKFNDLVNDLDVFSSLKYSVKGPNSLGSRSSHNVNTRLRGVHPSYLGYLDINTYSSSSPGLSGSVVPFTETKGLYFDDNPEPQDREFIIAEELAKEQEKDGMLVVHIGGGDAIKYYDAKYKMMQQCQEFSIKEAKDDGMLYVDVELGDTSFI